MKIEEAKTEIQSIIKQHKELKKLRLLGIDELRDSPGTLSTEFHCGRYLYAGIRINVQNYQSAEDLKIPLLVEFENMISDIKSAGGLR